MYCSLYYCTTQKGFLVMGPSWRCLWFIDINCQYCNDPPTPTYFLRGVLDVYDFAVLLTQLIFHFLGLCSLQRFLSVFSLKKKWWFTQPLYAIFALAFRFLPKDVARQTMRTWRMKNLVVHPRATRWNLHFPLKAILWPRASHLENDPWFAQIRHWKP